MADETEAPAAAAAPPAPAEPAPPMVESVEARVARLEERMDDTEAVAGAALIMHLEDDVDEEPEVERTTVGARHEEKPEEEKEEPKPESPAESHDRHAGMFI